MKKNHLFIDKLQQLAQNRGVSLSQLSLAWLLAQDDSIVPIPGMKQRKYIEGRAFDDIIAFLLSKELLFFSIFFEYFIKKLTLSSLLGERSVLVSLFLQRN